MLDQRGLWPVCRYNGAPILPKLQYRVSPPSCDEGPDVSMPAAFPPPHRASIVQRWYTVHVHRILCWPTDDMPVLSWLSRPVLSCDVL